MLAEGGSSSFTPLNRRDSAIRMGSDGKGNFCVIWHPDGLGQYPHVRSEVRIVAGDADGRS